ncbi:hypothetical protein D3C84_186060 [compost metagenome]
MSVSAPAALVGPYSRVNDSDISMFTERHIERHQLPYFLKVFNRFTDQPIGYLGNVSEDGLMLISNLPLLVGPDFELQLKIPSRVGGLQPINLTASCLWCHEDATPGHYDSGFMLLQAPKEYAQLVGALQRYFSFYPLGASA